MTTQNFARVINGMAVDVSADPTNHFHTSLAVEFVEVPAQVQTGWRLVDGTWQAPEVVTPEPTPAPSVKVTPPQFKLLWLQAERIAIKRIRTSTAPEHADLRDAMNDFFDILEDERLTEVDLGLQSVRDGIDSALQVLQGAGVVQDVAQRKAAILSGALV